jgi:hypothetical protein
MIKIYNWLDVPRSYTGIVEHINGSKAWCLKGQLHREDGPAHEYPDGTKYWYLNGGYHREDGPAVEYSNGLKAWYLNGKFLFTLPPESQSFILLEEFVDGENKKQLKVLTQKGIEIL